MNKEYKFCENDFVKATTNIPGYYQEGDIIRVLEIHEGTKSYICERVSDGLQGMAFYKDFEEDFEKL